MTRSGSAAAEDRRTREVKHSTAQSAGAAKDLIEEFNGDRYGNGVVAVVRDISN
jgi:hypothetical protein